MVAPPVYSRKNPDRKALLQRWVEQGDSDALGTLVHLDLGEIKRLFRRQTSPWRRRSAATTDWLNEAVLRVLQMEQPPNIHHPRVFQSYMAAAARNLCNSYHERAHRTPISIDSVPADLLDEARCGTGLDAGSVAAADAVRAALLLLCKEDRKLIIEHFWERRSNKVVALEQGVSRKTIANRLNRAMRRLQRELTRLIE
ncbi:MAG: sigma-70 family RNA polymerase sigma factor [Planctomycetota bacterium]